MVLNVIPLVCAIHFMRRQKRENIIFLYKVKVPSSNVLLLRIKVYFVRFKAGLASAISFANIGLLGLAVELTSFCFPG